ncbi:MAG TPA: YncE family protein [Rhizomicrobium sp.]|nr:YncE family protein [Rhizomicrobium sp.]
MTRGKNLLLTASFLFLSAAAAGAATDAPGYRLTKSVSLGSPERWDYTIYDKDGHRVFVAHGDKVAVVDAESGRLLGNVEGIHGGTHGTVAVNGKGYTDDGEAGQVIVFDLKTFKILNRLKAEDDADGIAFDRVSGHIFVIDGDSKAITVVDPKSDQVVDTIHTGGGLEAAVSGGDGKLYVNGSEKKELIRIDTATNKVEAHWPIPNCTSPHGLAIDSDAHRLFVSCVNKVMTVVNADNGAVVATVPIGQGTDSAAFDAKRKLAFSSNGGDGTISVIREVNPNSFVSAGEIKTKVTGRTMDIDPDTGRLFVAAADIDPNAPVPPGKDGRPGRPKPLPGTLKLLIFDPAQ